MSYLKWAIAGLVGAAAGGLVWFLIGYYAKAEVGYIAVLVGFLAGLGVRVAASESEVGTGPAMAALIAAFFGIAVAKYAVTRIRVDNILAPMIAQAMADPSESERHSEMANEVAEKREAVGKPVAWPAGKDLESAELEADYPADIWAEAKQRLDAETPEQRQLALQQRQQMLQNGLGEARQAIIKQVFVQSFGMYDLLWFGLAGMAAWRTGSGLASDDE